MKRLFYMGCLAYLLIGLAHIVIGALLNQILAHYGRDYSDGGTLVFAQFAGLMAGVLSAPAISRKLGTRGGLVLASVLLFAAETLYSLLPPWEWLFVLAPLAGFGFGMIETLVGSGIIDAFADRKAVAMSRLEVFFSLGALIMPVVTWMFVRSSWWNGAFALIGLFSLVMAFLWGKLSFGPMDAVLSRAPQAADPQMVPTANRHPYRGKGFLLVLFILFFILYVGLEMSLVNFLPSMLVERFRLEAPVAALSVTVFWIAMSIGRLYAGVLAEKITYARYLLGGCLTALVFLAGFAAFPQKGAALVFILLIGLSLSGLFSIALVFANHLLPGATGRTTSLLIASGGVGGALLPLLTGESMDRLHVGPTQWLVAGAALVLLLLITVLRRYDAPGRTTADKAF